MCGESEWGHISLLSFIPIVSPFPQLNFSFKFLDLDNPTRKEGWTWFLPFYWFLRWGWHLVCRWYWIFHRFKPRTQHSANVLSHKKKNSLLCLALWFMLSSFPILNFPFGFPFSKTISSFHVLPVEFFLLRGDVFSKSVSPTWGVFSGKL